MVLGACVGRKKSKTHGVMFRADLEDNIGIILESRGTSVDEVLRGLLNFEPPLLTNHGQGIAASNLGERVKHVFDELKNELVVYAVPREHLIIPEAYDALIFLMNLVCEDPNTHARELAKQWRNLVNS